MEKKKLISKPAEDTARMFFNGDAGLKLILKSYKFSKLIILSPLFQ